MVILKQLSTHTDKNKYTLRTTGAFRNMYGSSFPENEMSYSKEVMMDLRKLSKALLTHPLMLYQPNTPY